MIDDRLNVAAVLAPSFANGPGSRFVVWVQGCSLHCPGCQNPHTWSTEPRHLVGVEQIVNAYDAHAGLRGLTLSGGEPFEQAAPLNRLAREVHARGGDVVAFSGFTLHELQAEVRPGAAALLGEIDVLVDGPYRRELPTRRPLVGSENQVVHHLTSRIAPDELVGLPRLEWVGAEGRGRLTGFGGRALPSFLDAARSA